MIAMINKRNYSQKLIDDTLRARNGTRKVSFRYDLLNRFDVKIGELDGVEQATISYGEFRIIKRTAKFLLNEYLQKEIDYMSERIQPWFILHMPDGGTVGWSLGIFLLESPSKIINNKVSSRDIGAYDKTIIVEEDKFFTRFLVAQSQSYVSMVVRILESSGLTKIDIPDNGVTIANTREFPIGKKKHLACNELLRAINYTSIWIDENGVAKAKPYIEPSSRPVTHFYSTDEKSVVLNEFSERLDIAGRANVFIRVALNLKEARPLVSTVENNDILSPISIINRGRKIVNFEELHDVSSQEALDGITRRALLESMSAFSHLSFNTALMPTHGSAETLLCDFAKLFDTPTRFYETSWEMPLEYDGIMTHEARKVTRL